jgi:hypothetical protein
MLDLQRRAAIAQTNMAEVGKGGPFQTWTWLGCMVLVGVLVGASGCYLLLARRYQDQCRPGADRGTTAIDGCACWFSGYSAAIEEKMFEALMLSLKRWSVPENRSPLTFTSDLWDHIC